MNLIDDYLNEITEKDATIILKELLTSPEYEEDEYTDTQQNIIERYEEHPRLTKKEFQSVKIHLKKHSDIWF